MTTIYFLLLIFSDILHCSIREVFYCIKKKGWGEGRFTLYTRDWISVDLLVAYEPTIIYHDIHGNDYVIITYSTVNMF